MLAYDASMTRASIVVGLRLMAWGCVGLLAVLSLLPSDEVVRTSLSGHVEHAMAYAGTAFLARLGYREHKVAWGVVTLIIYAGILEYLQHFSVGRSPAVEDWVASSAGVLVGCGAAQWITLWISRLIKHTLFGIRSG